MRNDQDDQVKLGYCGPAVLAVLTWAKKTETGEQSSDSYNSNEPAPMPLRATSLSPSSFDFGPSDGALEISDDEPTESRLEKVAINVVKISKLFGGGRWIPVSKKDYSDFCDPRKVPGSERSLFLELVLRRVLVADGDKYAVGPQMGFFLSGYVTDTDSLAA